MKVNVMCRVWSLFRVTSASTFFNFAPFLAAVAMPSSCRSSILSKISIPSSGECCRRLGSLLFPALSSRRRAYMETKGGNASLKTKNGEMKARANQIAETTARCQGRHSRPPSTVEGKCPAGYTRLSDWHLQFLHRHHAPVVADDVLQLHAWL